MGAQLPTRIRRANVLMEASPPQDASAADADRAKIERASVSSLLTSRHEPSDGRRRGGKRTRMSRSERSGRRSDASTNQRPSSRSPAPPELASYSHLAPVERLIVSHVADKRAAKVPKDLQISPPSFLLSHGVEAPLGGLFLP